MEQVGLSPWFGAHLRNGCGVIAALAAAGFLAAPVPAVAAPCALDAARARLASVAGEPALRTVMDRLAEVARRAQPSAAEPESWTFNTDATLLGDLMFERTDLVAVTAPFSAAALVPYQHQFRG